MNLLWLLISPLPVPAGWYALPLRLIIGFGFMQHGYAKLAREPEDFFNVLHAMGLPAPFILGWATIIVELIGGLMILVGALIPLATVPMAIVLLVAIVTVHLPNGFSSIKLQSFDAAGAHFGQPGYETDLLYLAGLLALCLGGPGPISIDGLLSSSISKSEVKARHNEVRETGHRRLFYDGWTPPTASMCQSGGVEHHLR
jgi:putative oxidoreductase